MNKTKKICLFLSIFFVLFGAIGLTYAWFSQNAAMSTLLKILPPDEITIIPVSEPDGAEMVELDLDFHNNSNDKKDDDGTIHIIRPLCIKSTSPVHRLEVVHTTNLKNLEFNIFPAVKGDTGFSYNSEIIVDGSYKNKDDNTGLAKEEILENYTNTSDVADIHAYPLYWIAVNCGIQEECESGWQVVSSEIKTEFDPATKTEKEFYYTYYYIEISWKEESKETDLFYIMAQNVAE